MLNEYYGKKFRYPDLVELLIEAQNGSKIAEEQLILNISTNIMGRRIGKYFNKNRQVENDDLKQVFLMAVYQSISKAKLDVGDPIEFIITQGVYAVRSYMRKHIIQGTMQICADCGDKSRLNKVGFNTYQCKKCGSTRIDTFEVEDKNEMLLENIETSGFEDEILDNLMLSDFKSTLTPGTNLYSLYELMIERQINRDNPQIKNYVKAIADEWGGCSNQNVIRNLKKLQDRFLRWAKENDYDICVTIL